MGTGRKFHKKPVTRPKKGAAERRVRTKIQKARLVKIGFDPDVVTKMDIDKVRDLLKQYAKKSTRKYVEALVAK
jgi:hypothetical protein